MRLVIKTQSNCRKNYMIDKSQSKGTMNPTENFGLLLGLFNNGTLENAIALENYSNYGNKIYIFTNCGSAARKTIYKNELSMKGYMKILRERRNY